MQLDRGSIKKYVREFGTHPVLHRYISKAKHMSLSKKIGIGITSSLALIATPALVVASYGRITNNSSASSSTQAGDVTVSATTSSDSSGDAQSAANKAAGTAGTPTDQTSDSSSQLTINGENVPMPDNGSVHKSIPSNNGNVKVDVSIQNNGSTSNYSSSGSTSLHIYSNNNSTSVSGTNNSGDDLAGRHEER